MPAHLLAGHAFDRGLQSTFQLVQVGIHRTTLAFPRASGRMLRDIKTH
jgi:hypothetical protein